MIRVLVAAVLLLAAPAAQAQGRKPMTASERADKTCGGSNPEILSCVAGFLDREDARLNRAYKAALTRMRPAQQDQLRREQRQWIKARDAECEAELEGGGGQASIYATVCVLRLTETRADDLERMARPSRPR